MRYERILAAVAATPWAIELAKGLFLADLLSRRAAGERVTEAEAGAAVAAKRPKAKARPGAVALVPVYGVMTQRAGMFDDVSGLTSTEQIGAAIDEAAADPAVEAI